MRPVLIGMAIAALVLGGITVRAQAKATYKVVGVGPSDTNESLEKQLNADAAAGWELVAVLPQTFNNLGVLGQSNPERIVTSARLILKRQVK